VNRNDLMQPPGTERQIRLLVATHPYLDHIGRMTGQTNRSNGPGPAASIDRFWEPGHFQTQSFHNLTATLESSPWIRRLQPTSGTTMTLDALRLTGMGRDRLEESGIGYGDNRRT
jgi:hypothetical protein